MQVFCYYFIYMFILWCQTSVCGESGENVIPSGSYTPDCVNGLEEGIYGTRPLRGRACARQ